MDSPKIYDKDKGNYSGLPLSTGAKKRAATVMGAPLLPEQRVRSESAAGKGTDTVAVHWHAGAPCAEAKWLT
jgi:hypothetical protein